jgi:2-phosphoglycerate kinase
MNNESLGKIILIGGAPTVGKSTMAALVSRKLNIPWISTDQIREIMRVTARREDIPKLFTPEGYTAEKFLTEFSAEQIVQMEIEQGEAVWAGIKKLIEDDYTWRDGFIIEGVGILPRLVKKDFGDSKNVRAVFLIDEDEDRTREVVFSRGLWDDARTYLDDVKEKEVEWSTLFSRKMKVEAERYSYPYVEVSKNNNDIDAVLKAIN